MLFQEASFIDRLKRARAAGFAAVEMSTPELFNHPAQEVASALQKEGLECVLFNMPAGDWNAGERGLAALQRAEDFERSLEVTADYAARLKCPRVHCLAGLTSERDSSDAIYRQNLERAVRVLGSIGVEVVIEPINQRSMPGYHLSSLPHAAATIEAVSENLPPELRGSLKLLFDFFHCQIMHGDLTMNLRKYADLIGHVQVAGVPDRAEPDNRQEVNFPPLFQLLRHELAYTGHIGLEYHPRRSTEEGLGWLERLTE
ncbi:hyi [Symbiodinium natans]|uniref:Putative hydroxypyruvate isomerase n=1 Tax=Symbiodinium natans TaxID=878477 RepID=A0A812TGH3_9DINO|nr:hyi [Symbiodinium natans]